jgi:integrase
MAVWNKRGAPRERRCFPTLQEAREWLERRRTEGEPPPLTGAQYASAQAALAVLPPGVTLLEAARAFAASARRGGAGEGTDGSLRLREALARFLGERRSVTAEVTWKSYEHTVLAFADALEGDGDPPLAEIAPAQIAAWVSEMNPSARNKALRHLSPLFGWAVRRGFLSRNPCQAVDRARGVEPPRGILAVADADRLLHAAAERDPKLVPYLAIGLFAGIRPAEIARLSAGCIGPEYIRLDASVTKAARARTVAIRPNLRAWLDAFPPAFPLVDWAALHRLTLLHQSLGIPWPSDCMRHSFATYAWELSRDAVAIAAEMGHRGIDVFFRHYRALALPGDGAKFFGIMP